MTLSNKLTILRGLAAVVFIPIVNIDHGLARAFALLIYTLASISDYYDGRLARMANQKTDFGVIADPIADKLLVGACLISISLIDPRLIPMWMTVIILLREFGVTVFRFYALSQGRVLAAEKLGKWKTGLQMALIPVALVVITLLTKPNGPRWESLLTRLGVLDFIMGFVWWFAFGTMILTLWSGASFLLKNRK